MERASSLLRRLGMFFLVMNIFLPFSIDAVFAKGNDEPPTGTLTIALLDGVTGAAVPGGSFEVSDGVTTKSANDWDDGNDGYTAVYGLAVGPVTVYQTGGPDSHYVKSGSSSANVNAGNPTTLEIYNQPVPPPDSDGDGTPDNQDSTPFGEPDTDGDGTVDSQDRTPNGDGDGDGVDNLDDICPGVANVGFDNDDDGVDNACDADDLSLIDSDSDGFTNDIDNCVDNANPNQLDSDSDGAGDACDAPPLVEFDNDSDTDTSIDTDTDTGTSTDTDTDTDTDTTTTIDNGTDTDTSLDTDTDTGIQLDTDGDGVADADDNCIKVENKDQLNTDGDKLGDACDDDDDNDGLTDTDEADLKTDPLLADTDGDGDNDGDEVKAGTDPLASDTTTAPCDTSTDTTGEKTAGTEGSTDPRDVDATTEDPCAQLVSTLKSAAFTTLAATLTLDKTGVYAAPDTTYPNGSITYTFVVTNTGTEALGDVEISDPLLGPTPLTVGVLGPAGSSTDSATVFATYALTTTDAAGTQIQNTATVTGKTAAGGTVTASDMATVQLTTTEATVSNILFRAYTPTAANLASPSANDGTPDQPELQAEDFFCGAYVHFYNEITVATGTDATFILQNNFGIDSTGQSGVGYGDVVAVRVISGNATASLQSESVSGGNIQARILLSDVDAGEVIEVRVVAQLVCGPNAANATGNVQAELVADGGNQTINLKLAGANFETPAPAISMTKVCPTSFPPTAEAGDTVRFPVTIENTGNVALSGIFVTDDQPGSFDGSFSTMLTPDAPAETVDFLYVLTPTDISNAFVTNTARVDTFQTDEQSSSTGNCSFTPGAPSVELTKTGPATIDASGLLTYTITITNSGTADATGLSFVDELPPTGNIWTWTETVNGVELTGTDQKCTLNPVPIGASGTRYDLDCSNITVPANDGTTDGVYQIVIMSDTAGGQCGSTYVNDLSGVEGVPDTNPDNNTVTTTVVCRISPEAPTVTDGTCVDGTATDPSVSVPGDNTNFDYSTLTTANNPDGTITFSFTATAISPGVILPDQDSLPDGYTRTSDTVATYSNTLDVVPCLEITKVAAGEAAGDGTVEPGDDLVFTVTVTNNGDAQATGVTFTDDLPEVAGQDWAFVETPFSTPTKCTYTGAGDSGPESLSCGGIDIAPGGAFVVTLTSATADSSANCGAYDNTATLTGDFASNDGPASASITVACAPAVDLEKTVPAGSETIIPGENLIFTITVTNNGSAAAPDVSFDDGLPVVSADPGELWHFDGTAPTECTISAPSQIVGIQTLDCTGIDLDAGGDSFSVTVTILTMESPDNCGDIPNTANLTGETYTDTNTGNNTATVTVDCAPELLVRKTPDTGSATAGDLILFTIEVVNLGTEDALNVDLDDMLPSDPGGLVWEFPATDPWEDFTSCTLVTNVLHCDADSIPPGGSAEVTVQAQTGTTSAACGDVINPAATASADNADPYTDDIASINVQCFPSVSLAKTVTAEDATIAPGEVARFTITATNSGAGEATGVSFEDELPVGLTWSWTENGVVSPVDPKCDTTTLSGFLTCDEITIAAGGSFVVVLTATTATDSTNCGPIVNEAALTSTEESSENSGDNTATIDVTCTPDVDLAKSAANGSIIPGENLEFTITVTNSGTADAPDVGFSDPLPAAGLDWNISLLDPDPVPGGGTCDINDTTKTLTCSGIDLGPVGDDFSITVTSATGTTLDVCGLQSNTASLTGETYTETGEELDNNTAFTTIVCTIAFDITKDCPSADDLNGAGVGDTIYYQVTVRNTGDVDLPITVTDSRNQPPGSDNGYFVASHGSSDESVFPSTILAGTDETRWYRGTITTTDAALGNVNNTATLTVAQFAPETANAGGGEGCAYTPVTTIEITKSCPESTDGLRVGNNIVYTIRIENTGDLPLSSIVVDEGRTGVGANNGFDPALPAELAPQGETGSVYTGTFTTQVTSADAGLGSINNHIEVTAFVAVTSQRHQELASLGGVPLEPDASDTADANCAFTPVTDFTVAKGCPETAEKRVDDQIIYPVTITNTGDVDITITTLGETRSGTFYSDLALTAVIPATGASITVVPGTPVTIYFVDTITSTDASDGNVNNTVTVTGQVQIGEGDPTVLDPVSDAAGDGETGCPFTPVTGLEVTKSCPNTDELGFGDPISYTITLENTGDVAITDLVFTDSRESTGDFDIDPDPLPTSIAPNTTLTVTFNDTINQNDVDTFAIANQITVDGNITIGTADPEPVQASAFAGGDDRCLYTPKFSLTVAKACPTAQELDGASPGDVIIYPITITNTGDLLIQLDADEIIESDRTGTFHPNPDGTGTLGYPLKVPPASSDDDNVITVYFKTTIQPQDAANGNVNNTVTVTGHVSFSKSEMVLPPVSADAKTGNVAGCAYSPDTGFTVAKACPDTAEKRVDDQIVYPVTITNSGDVDVTVTTLGETRTGTFYSDLALTTVIPASGASITVSPGTPVTIYFVDTITQQDADNRNVDNTVTVTGEVQVGEGDAIVLAPVADAAGDGEDGCPYTPFIDYTFSKECPDFANGNAVGDTIAYKITVENTGDVDLTGLTVTDSRGTVEGGFFEDAAGTTASSFPGIITPEDGPITRYYVTTIQPEDANAGNAVNAATINANEIETSTTSAGSEAGCPFTPVTGVTITKSCPTFDEGVTQPRKGDNITYIVTIENIGDVEVTDLAVTDTRANGIFVEAIPGTLGARATLVLTFVDTIQQSDIDTSTLNNSATVTGKISIGTVEPVVTDVSETANTAANNGETGCPFTPVVALTVTKSCPEFADGTGVGSTIFYMITLKNEGDVTIDNLMFSDTREATGDFAGTLPTSIDPSATVFVTFNDTIQPGDAAARNVDNTVSVTGDYSIGGADPVKIGASADAGTDETTGCPFDPVTGIEITKSCPTGIDGLRVGAPITYTITVKNTGDVGLNTIVVTDDRDPTFSQTIDALAPDASTTVTFTSSITLTDAANQNVDNTASVTANIDQPPAEIASMMGVEVPVPETVSDSYSTATDGEGCPFDPFEQVTITKTCPAISPGTRVGSSITYNVTIENTGDVPLTNIVVTDERDGSFSADFPTTLDPDDEPVTRIFTSAITSQDAQAANVDNSATVTADATSGETVTKLDETIDQECPFDPFEDVTITKDCPTVAELDGARAGATIHYKVTVTNSGDVPLSDLAVTEVSDRTGDFYLTTTATEPSAFPDTLARGETEIRYFRTTILGTDASSNTVDNEISVTANAVVGEGEGSVTTPVSDSFSADCPFNPVEGVDITKSCPDVADFTRVGTVIIYPVTITNTGDVALTSITVSDNRVGTFHTDSAAATPALTMPLDGVTLAPFGQDDDELTLYFKTQITGLDAANQNINNTATVSADAGEEIVQKQFTAQGEGCGFTPFAGIDITKTCPDIADGARVGAEMEYEVTVTNTGDVPLDITSVTDDRGDGFESAFPATLAPSGFATRTFTDQITHDDAANGNVNNIVTVNTGQGVSETFDTAANNDATGCLYTPVTGIEITKSCPIITAGERVDDPISYTITVRNTGDVELSNIVVTDERGETWSEIIASLAPAGLPGSSATVTFTSAITLDDAADGNVDNTASVAADVGAAQPQETASLIGVAQTEPPTVEDTYNTATDGDGCPFTPVSDIEIAKSCPDIVFGTRVDAQIVYEITLSNAGDIVLTVDNVLETRAGTLYTDAGLTTVATFPLALAPETQPGDSVTLYFASMITAQDALDRNVDNTATVQTAELPDEDAVAGGEAGCPFTPVGIIAIDKTCPTIADGARIGDEITYQVTITNTGDAKLVDIDVDESRNGDYDSPFPEELARGESAIRTFTSTITPQDALNGNVDNSASVTTSDAVLASDIGAETSVECPFEPLTGIEILKACPGAEELADARVGDPISYEITVKNIGDVELSNIVVTDDRDPGWSETIASLARQGQTGDTATVTFTSAITLGDAANGNVDNTATVTANVGPAQETASLIGVAQAETVTASDSATADCPYTAFVDVDIQKACPLADQLNGARAGDAISYEITVKNTGDVELSNLVVTDSRDDSWSETIASLAPGASTVVTFTGNITFDDAAHGNVDNTASVTANVGPAQETASLIGVAQATPGTVSDTVTVRCTFDPFESVQVTKSCPTIANGARVGDEITYEVTITNGGDVKLTGIAVTDDRDGSFDSAFPAELAPGASATRTFSSEITGDDAANGNVNNTAHVTAVAGGVSGGSGNGALQSAATGAGATIAVTVSGRVTANCAFAPVVDLDLDKSCPDIATGARVGDEISYEVTITNTGDVTITGIDITDTRDGAFDAPFPAALDPGTSATRTFTSTITAGDAENGNVDNVATVIATATSGRIVFDELTDEASATCDFTPFVDVQVEKSGNGPINAGDEATFTITVSNIGDVVATDVTVNDELPGVLGWALDPEVDDCVIAGGVLDCEFDSLAAGASVEISVSAETPSERCDDLYNIVSIGAANESAGTTANNAASAIITVDCGTVEIVKVICTVHKDHDVAFEVTTPGDETGDDSYESYDGSWCKPLKDVEFTIDGEQLDAPVAVKTGKDGTVSAILPPGDYTITEVSTKASEAFSVVADDTTTVKVFNFTVIEIPAPKPTPEPTETPEVVTSLPTTGAGPASGNDDSAWILMVMSVVLCGGAAYALRRRAA